MALTDDDRDLLRDWWDEDETAGVESSFPIISRIIAARMAKAWDEGLAAGAARWMDCREFGDEPANPYRDRRPEETA